MVLKLEEYTDSGKEKKNASFKYIELQFEKYWLWKLKFYFK